jgi:cytochrome c biogenesis protein CcdA
MDLLAEGFESALMACSLIILAPGVATALAARRAAIPALGAFSLAVLAASWLRFSDRGGGLDPLLIAIVLGAAVGAFAIPRLSHHEASAVGGGLLAGTASAELWRPCVGFEFGQVLNSLPDRGPSGFGQMAVYLVGVLSPLLALGAVHHLVPEHLRDRAEPWLGPVGALALGALALATALGLHDDLVGKLFEWSIEG